MTTLEKLPAPAPTDLSQQAPTGSGGLRLTLRTPGITGGFVDGGWWPRSMDLSLELPPLLEEMRSAGYDVYRITYNLTFWEPAPPRRMTVAGRVIKLGGYRTQNVAVITLVDTSGSNRVDLVVVPPDTEPLIAERALALAGRDGDLHRAAEVLECARPATVGRISHTGCVDQMPSAAWETDGGKVLAS